MRKTPLILVGGFLGAGKTTLIAAAARKLAEQGKRAAVVTNDQAANLVDTATLRTPDLPIQEVSGGCFCCRFDDLVEKMQRMIEDDTPDVLIGEPVGSCTDLSATVLQPIKSLLADRLCLAPFSVVVDAAQVEAALDDRRSRFPDNVAYIYRKQLEEADLIVMNKIDCLGDEELSNAHALLRRQFPQAPVFTTSAREGVGLAAWLDHVLSRGDAGRTITEVDYDLYADGEAALGWLNASVRLHAAQPLDGRGVCRDLAESIRRRLQESEAEIAHLKLHMTMGQDVVVANLTNNLEPVSVRGEVDRGEREAQLLVNVRAKIDPAPLREITEACLQAMADDGLHLAVEEIDSFAPGRPRPTHRFPNVLYC